MAATTNILLVAPGSGRRRDLARRLQEISIVCLESSDGLPGAVTISPDEIAMIVLCAFASPDCASPHRISDIRSHYADIPLLAIVEEKDRVGMRRVMDAGVDDCITLGPTMIETAARIRNVLTQHSANGLEPCQATSPLPETVASEHRVFLDRLDALRDEARRNGEPLCLLMIDIDRFRDCNERFSTGFGDYVLAWFARLLRRVCRTADLVSRYEGDRYLAALPMTRADAAERIAERCRTLVEQEPPRCQGKVHEVLVSVAIVESTPGFVETNHQLLQRARLTLEHAKSEGGNRTLTWAELLRSMDHRSHGGHSLNSVARSMSRIHEQLRAAYLESTQALVAAVDAKDPFARAHSLKVSSYAECIARRLGLSPAMVRSIRTAATLHDIGKIGVPDALLTKPGPLTSEEMDLMRRHPARGVDILRHASFLTDELPLILHHHERYDGKGYPDGLAGQDIPIGARVLAVADALDVMLCKRSYKQPYEAERVATELKRGAGNQFDPEIATVALEWLEEQQATAGNTQNWRTLRAAVFSQ